MSKQAGFDARLVWRDDGHLGDAALTCFVDGEESILPSQAAPHLDACDACAARLADLALVAARAVELFAERAPVAIQAEAQAKAQVEAAALAKAPVAARVVPIADAKPSPSRRPPVRVPLWAVAAALVLAGVSAAPAAFDAMRASPGWLLALGRALPVVMQSVGVVVRHGSAALMPALVIAAVGSLVLVVLAASVARKMSRSAPLEGGV